MDKHDVVVIYVFLAALELNYGYIIDRVNMLGQDYSRMIIHEVGKLMAMTALIAVFFLVGAKAEVLSGAARRVVDSMRSGDAKALRVDWNPTPTTNPWLLTENDLDYQRVIMNWTEKPGFWWLGLYTIGVMVGVGIMLVNLRLMGIAITSLVRRVKKMRFEVGHLGVAISGTVRISARSGVIYLSGLPKVMVDGLEEYGFMLRGVQVAVVPVQDLQ